MPDTPTSAESQVREPTSTVLYPLDEFYAQAGNPLPQIEAVAPDDLPEPYRSLLVHDSDMTSTLEKFHDEKIHLEVFRRQRVQDTFFREVILLLESGTPVEFGAIKIDLSLFDPVPQQLILEGRLPLGRILQDCNIPYISRPQAFLKLKSDPFINTVLRLAGSHDLYGRRNSLFDSEERPMAEIVEILPPNAPRGTALQ